MKTVHYISVYIYIQNSKKPIHVVIESTRALHESELALILENQVPAYIHFDSEYNEQESSPYTLKNGAFAISINRNTSES
jgi:hypothetical protein